MITPGLYNLTIYQGADFDKTFTVLQSGTALNFTGYTAAMQIRTSADAPTYLLSLTNGSGITLGGTAGTIALNITSAQSSALSAGSFSYDLELNSGSQITRILQGSCTVSGNVTR
jgi:hypothetical protein